MTNVVGGRWVAGMIRCHFGAREPADVLSECRVAWADAEVTLASVLGSLACRHAQCQCCGAKLRGLG